MSAEMAVLRDDCDLVWLTLSGLERRGGDVLYDVHLMARDEPGEPPEPFLSGYGFREPIVGLAQLIDHLGEAVAGSLTALRHDPIADGLSIELKLGGQGNPPQFEVVAWLDLTRTSRALKARATRGRHQVGTRFFTDLGRLEEFRAGLIALANSAADQ
jgi:hypothetical protein